MEQISNLALRAREVVIKRGLATFRIPVKQIMVSTSCFMCRKCLHQWLPKDRDFNIIPLHCPKCYDKYWFLSHEEIKSIKRMDNKQYSSVKEAWEKPASKLAVKHVIKEDWD